MAQQYGNSSEVTVTMAGPFGGGGGSSAKLGNIELPAANWKGAVSPYSQEVAVDGVSVNSSVNLIADVDQIAYLRENGIALVAGNEGGVVTVYAIGNKPTENVALQATILEVVS